MRHLIEYIDAPYLFGCKIYGWRQNAFHAKGDLPEDLFTEKLFLVHPFGPAEGGGIDRRREGRAKTANF